MFDVYPNKLCYEPFNWPKITSNCKGRNSRKSKGGAAGVSISE